MKLILLQNVPALGKKNEVVEVKPGYARNFLIPRSLGIQATPNAIKRLDSARSKEAEKGEKLAHRAEELRDKINETKIDLMKMTDGTKLFGSVGIKELRTALSNAIDFQVPAGMIQLKHTIKETGTYMIPVQITDTVHGKFTLNIKKEK